MLKQIPKLYLTPELQTGIAFCSDGNAFSQYVRQLPLPHMAIKYFKSG